MIISRVKKESSKNFHWSSKIIWFSLFKKKEKVEIEIKNCEVGIISSQTRTLDICSNFSNKKGGFPLFEVQAKVEN